MNNKIDIKSMILGGVLACGVVFSIAAGNPSQPADVLRIRKLIIVDEKGAERVVIGAPLDDPKILGKQLSRRSPATGVQINDASGNERGGIAMLEDGSFVVGIDDEGGRERAHMYFIPKRGVGLQLQGTDSRERIALSIPADSAAGRNPGVEITNREGRTTARLPALQ